MNTKEFGAIYKAKPWLKHYPEGVPATFAITPRSFPEIFDEATDKFANLTALIFYGKKLTYKQLRGEVDRLATGLSSIGVGRGTKVGLYLANCPQFIIAYLGAVKAGATVVPISPLYVSREVKYQIEDSETDTLVCLDLLYDRVEAAGVKLKNVILTNIADYLPAWKRIMGKSVLREVYYGGKELPGAAIFEKEGFYRFRDLIKNYPPDPPKIKFDPEEDVMGLQYTGGTTGPPKGAMFTHHYVQVAAYLLRVWWPFWVPADINLAYAPLFHAYGQFAIYMLLEGVTNAIFATPNLDDMLDLVERYRPKLFLGTPALYESLLSHEKTYRINWRRFKVLASAADALLESTFHNWKRRTGTTISEFYGATEMGMLMANPLGNEVAGSFGIPYPGVMAAVIDPETNRFLPVGEIGELVIQYACPFKGYWKQPEATKEAQVEIDGEKWLRTSDLVRMDDQGYFYFYDRKRDLIKYKGYSVFAREVEEVLATHPQIRESGVVGVPDPRVGEIIKAVVVLESDARGRVSGEDIIKYCEPKLAHYKVPKIVEFAGEIPKTDIGKVSRRELREWAQEA